MGDCCATERKKDDPPPKEDTKGSKSGKKKKEKEETAEEKKQRERNAKIAQERIEAKQGRNDAGPGPEPVRDTALNDSDRQQRRAEALKAAEARAKAAPATQPTAGVKKKPEDSPSLSGKDDKYLMTRKAWD
eukprot:gnl/TRDRNA2_/TRDRNA2_44356_c0_seq1.p3 gnl/TRDRNA2_/TRDRNA2_44356_c0~~gnl/TRDRNA2_/TRDRNA2_44356_c0_seq1.p3  ORF type:complete len:132 (-),score=37.68 gnl/TRDRNA2_/TRDRNA2_44356_c0_seq1:180-575(-)